MTKAAPIHPEGRSDCVRQTPEFFVAGRFAESFAKRGLTSLDAVFAFDVFGGEALKPVHGCVGALA